MSAATLTKSIRPPSVRQYWTVPLFTDLVLNGASIMPGDYVKVVATSLWYECISPEEYFPLTAGFTQATKGFETNFADLVGEALADTDATVTLAGSGLRIHGQGIAETDSGVTVANIAGGPTATCTTTDEVAHTIALSFGGNTEMWTPATNGPYNVYAEVAMSSAITLRAFFLGFLGAMADALDPALTYATTVLTLVQDNLQGLTYSSELTDADRIYAAYNNADGAASIATTAAGVDTGSNFPAAGTYVKLLVRVEPDGTMKSYVDGTLLSTIPSAAATSVAVNPVMYLESNSTAVKSMLVRKFAAWSEA